MFVLDGTTDLARHQIAFCRPSGYSRNPGPVDPGGTEWIVSEIECSSTLPTTERRETGVSRRVMSLGRAIHRKRSMTQNASINCSRSISKSAGRVRPSFRPPTTSVEPRYIPTCQRPSATEHSKPTRPTPVIGSKSSATRLMKLVTQTGRIPLRCALNSSAC